MPVWLLLVLVEVSGVSDVLLVEVWPEFVLSEGVLVDLHHEGSLDQEEESGGEVNWLELHSGGSHPRVAIETVGSEGVEESHGAWLESFIGVVSDSLLED